MNTKRIAFALAVLTTLALPLWAQAKTYTFGSDATFPPMEFVDANKNVVGFDVDMINAIGKLEGFTAVVKSTAWDGIFAGLTAGDYDGVLSSVTITDERKVTMDFSTPYLNAGPGHHRPQDHDERVHAFRPRRPQGGRADQHDRRHRRQPRSRASRKRRPTTISASRSRTSTIGRLDAVVVDSPTAAGYVLQNDKYKAKLKIVGEPFTEEYYGIAVKKGDSELLGLINKGLAIIMKDGTLDKLEEEVAAVAS